MTRVSDPAFSDPRPSTGPPSNPNFRKPEIYRLTSAGMKQLSLETSRWRKLAAAIARVVEPA